MIFGGVSMLADEISAVVEGVIKDAGLSREALRVEVGGMAFGGCAALLFLIAPESKCTIDGINFSGRGGFDSIGTS